MIEFIFMLTRDDVTVGNALDVLGEVRESGLRYVGFKDVGPPPAVLAEVTATAHAAGMEVMLEVVSTSREDELRSLRAAREIGVDWVLGGTHAREGAEILGGVGYCPFAGTVARPSERPRGRDRRDRRRRRAADGDEGRRRRRPARLPPRDRRSRSRSPARWSRRRAGR